AARRSDVAYHLGEMGPALEQARLAGKGFHEEVARRLAEPPADDRRRKLDLTVPRLPDGSAHPPVLVALAAFWNVEGEAPSAKREEAGSALHPPRSALHEAPPPDGPTDHQERQWAEHHGWSVREFTVTTAVAAELLDRGVPFAIALVEASFTQPQ